MPVSTAQPCFDLSFRLPFACFILRLPRPSCGLYHFSVPFSPYARARLVSFPSPRLSYLPAYLCLASLMPRPLSFASTSERRWRSAPPASYLPTASCRPHHQPVRLRLRQPQRRLRALQPQRLRTLRLRVRLAIGPPSTFNHTAPPPAVVGFSLHAADRLVMGPPTSPTYHLHARPRSTTPTSDPRPALFHLS